MILKPYYLGCLSHASYLVGDTEAGIAAIVDPQRDVDPYIDDAAALGLTIKHVFLTHFHADFVAGHLELRDKCGAEIHLGSKAKAGFPFSPMTDGTSVDIGSVRITALETPGHTPEGVSFVVYDLTHDSSTPHAVLTGDTLFIGDVGRPDLLSSAGMSAESLAGMLYDSLHTKLLKLPDETLVYPTHGAGSMCGRQLSTESVSTIGRERATNYALQARTRDEFIKMAITDLPSAPAYFSHTAELNRVERQTLDEARKNIKTISVSDALALAQKGAVLLDVRTSDAFANGHLPGSINIGLDGRFATWAGTLLDSKSDLVVIAEHADRVAEAVMRLGRIGFDRVVGSLANAPSSFGDSAQSTRERINASDADRFPDALWLDVRNPAEWRAGHLARATHIPVAELGRRMDEVPRDREIVVVCAGGYRSSAAASMLARAGYTNVKDLRGGCATLPAELLIPEPVGTA